MNQNSEFHAASVRIHIPVELLCDHFSKYFVDKIDKIKSISSVQKTQSTSSMNVYERVIEDEIKKLIFTASPKSCDLDPILTSVLKNCLDILKGLAQAKSVILFWHLNMTIWCKHVHRLELQKFF